MRHLLDNDILCNITKPVPSESLMAWMAEQADQDLFIAALSIAEIRRCVAKQPLRRRGLRLAGADGATSKPQVSTSRATRFSSP